MRAAWDINAITAAFTDAAVDPSRWTAAMETVRKVTGSHGAVLLPMTARLPNIPHSQSLAGVTEDYLRDGWFNRDERDKAWAGFDARGVGTEFDFTTPDEMARSAYYQEFLAPHGLRWFAGVKVACGDDLWCLSVQGSIAQGPFTRHELRTYSKLSASLASAAGLARVLAFARVEAALEAFEVSGTGAVLIGRYGQHVRANASAERLFGSDLQLRRGRLLSRERPATAALDRALHQLLWARDDETTSPPVLLPRRTGRPILAYPIRLTSLAQEVLGPAHGMVVLVDLERDSPHAQEVLRSLFRLTAAEARLAGLLASGGSLEEAAVALGVSYETVRNQLKAVFAKTDTRRQAELVALMNRVLLPLARTPAA